MPAPPRIGAAAHAGREQRARLGAVQALEIVGRDRPALGLEVHHLAADQARRAAGLAQHRGGAQPAAQAPVVPASSGSLGQEVEGARQQRVAGQDRDRLAEHHVRGRLAAAQVVVVHRGQVVVDQAVGVDHLDRAGERHQLARARRRRPRRHASTSTGRMRLPPGEQAVAHGAVDRRRPLASRPAAPGRAPRPPPRAAPHSRRGALAVCSPALTARSPRRGSASGCVTRPASRSALRLATRVLEQHLDLALGLLELAVAQPRQPDALLVELQRLLERQLAALELLHDLLELRERLLERGRVAVCHSFSLESTRGAQSARAAAAPSAPPGRDLGGVAHHARARLVRTPARSRGRARRAATAPSSAAARPPQRVRAGARARRGSAPRSRSCRSRRARSRLSSGAGGRGGRPPAARAAAARARAHARSARRSPRSARRTSARRRAGRARASGRARRRTRGGRPRASTRARTRASAQPQRRVAPALEPGDARQQVVLGLHHALGRRRRRGAPAGRPRNPRS